MGGVRKEWILWLVVRHLNLEEKVWLANKIRERAYREARRARPQK